jgi:excisionase family DNA binding protein
MQREFLTAADLAPAMGVTSGRIYQLLKAGEIPSVRIAGRVRVPRDAWEDYKARKNAEARGEELDAA